MLGGGIPSSLPFNSGSKVGSKLYSNPGAGKYLGISLNSEICIAGETALSETNCFTLVLKTGLCSQAPKDWSICA